MTTGRKFDLNATYHKPPIRTQIGRDVADMMREYADSDATATLRAVDYSGIETRLAAMPGFSDFMKRGKTE